ncbi:hypothetical protein TNCV_2923551 [Trichonephila clavipes]|nr:hypothetical protein TNCV_2923551 [Trichonephila clavipes]
MLSLEERIAIVSRKMGSKTYEEGASAVPTKIRVTERNKDQYQVHTFEEMLSLEERIAIVSWKMGSKTYEEVRQLYQLKYGKQRETRINIRVLMNKFRQTGSVVDEKHAFTGFSTP